jgi:hypothetical protein
MNGIKADRRWVVVGEDNKTVAQSSKGGKCIAVKTMCLLAGDMQGDRFVLTVPSIGQLSFPETGRAGEPEEIKILGRRHFGVDQGEEAAELLTTFLSQERQGKYRLFRITGEGTAPTKRGFAQIAGADGFQHLFVSESSLADLNERIGNGSVPMNRFRPNFVIGHDLEDFGESAAPLFAYEEDELCRILIGDVMFVNMGPCIRCASTLIDQETGEVGAEPLRTLAKYRSHVSGKGVIFGSNFNHSRTGIIRVGDEVRVSVRDSRRIRLEDVMPQ